MSKKTKKDDIIVAKFGGSAIASPQGIKKLRELFESEKNVFAIISAAGKTNVCSEKLTDLLIKLYNSKTAKKDEKTATDAIKNKFFDFFNRALNLPERQSKQQTEKFVFCLSRENLTKDELISRGEYLTALALCDKFDVPLIPPEKVIFLQEKECKINLKRTKNALNSLIFQTKTTPNKTIKAIIPGFYGNLNGKIKLLPRGGGDLSGACIALALNAKIYLNITDVEGVKNAPPSAIKNAKTFKRIAYSDLKRLIYAGAQVLSPEAAFLICKKRLKTKILSAFSHKNSPTTTTFKKHKKSFNAIALKPCLNNKNISEITILGKSFKSKKFRKNALKLLNENKIPPLKTTYNKNGTRFFIKNRSAEIAIKILYFNFISS